MLAALLLLPSYVSSTSADNYSKDGINDTSRNCPVNVNIKPALAQLGFTDENSSLASTLLIDSILETPTALIPNSDGTYNATVCLNSTQLNHIKLSPIFSTINTNISRVSHVNLRNTTPINQPINASASNAQASLVSQNSSLLTSDELAISSPNIAVGSNGLKACLIVAIWDYPGQNYLPEAEDEYNAVNDNIWGYDTVARLLNSDATKYNIEQTIIGLCNSYSIVDVYFIGHGDRMFLGLGAAYFCSWDTIDFAGGNTYYWNGIFDSDLVSSEAGDLSNLRLCVASFCYGWCLEDGFMFTGQYFAHDRSFMGPQGLLWVSTYRPQGTGNMFDATWTYDWCRDGFSSTEAYADAYNAAEPTVPNGCTNFAYAQSNQPIFYDFYISHADAWGPLSGSGNAWSGNNMQGQNNDNYGHIYGGNYGDAGYVRATMNEESWGEITVYGYGVDGYYNSDLYCYVSNDGYNWYPAPNNPVQVNYWDGLQYIDFGQAPITFRYISFTGYDDNGYSVSVMLDAVHVYN
jgi:hypothetical protein